MRHLAISALILSLTGCASALPPSTLGDYVTHHYYGREVNQFFVDYGMPTAEFILPDGAKIYNWNSAGEPFHRAGEPPLLMRGHNFEIAENYHAGTQTTYCELRLYTDPDGIMENITVAVDSMGKWGASRCNEIFY